MEKIKIVIVEDEFIIAEDISALLCQNGYEIISLFDHAEVALPFILNKKPDLLLVDIRLAGKMDGIELVNELNKTIRLPIIYITANSDESTYRRAKQTNPNAFLIKPFTSPNLVAAVDLALYNFSNNMTPDSISRLIEESIPNFQMVVNQHLFIRLNGKFKKINIDDLLFVEADGSYVHLQTNTDRYTLSENLAHFQKKTPLPDMLRIHRSYIVNLKKIDSFADSFIFIKNHKLPLGNNYKDDFLTHIHLL